MDSVSCRPKAAMKSMGASPFQVACNPSLGSSREAATLAKLSIRALECGSSKMLGSHSWQHFSAADANSPRLDSHSHVIETDGRGTAGQVAGLILDASTPRPDRRRTEGVQGAWRTDVRRSTAPYLHRCERGPLAHQVEHRTFNPAGRVRVPGGPQLSGLPCLRQLVQRRSGYGFRDPET